MFKTDRWAHLLRIAAAMVLGLVLAGAALAGEALAASAESTPPHSADERAGFGYLKWLDDVAGIGARRGAEIDDSSRGLGVRRAEGGVQTAIAVVTHDRKVPARVSR